MIADRCDERGCASTAGPGLSTEKSRVLVIDDDALVLSTLAAILRRAGYDVLLATDGDQGIDVVNRGRVDLVLTDIVMPNKEGIETIIELRKHHPDVKVIAISGGGTWGGANYLRLAEQLGASKILQKPVLPETVLEAVSDVLGS